MVYFIFICAALCTSTLLYYQNEMALHKEEAKKREQIARYEETFKDLNDKFSFIKIRTNEMLREEGLPEYDKLIKMFKKAYPEYML